jgi:uncharacterized Zn-binding protein involved in type VI secretion
MANFVHRNNDSRACGAKTRATVNNVRVNGRFISTEGDPNTHGGGALRATETSGRTRAGGKPIIILNDPASADALCPPLGPPHCNPRATSASGDVRAGG